MEQKCQYCGTKTDQKFCSESCALYAEQLNLLDAPYVENPSEEVFDGSQDLVCFNCGALWYFSHEC